MSATVRVIGPTWSSGDRLRQPPPPGSCGHQSVCLGTRLIVSADQDGHRPAFDFNLVSRDGTFGLPIRRTAKIRTITEPRASQHFPVAARPVLKIGDAKFIPMLVVDDHEIRLAGLAPPDHRNLARHPLRRSFPNIGEFAVVVLSAPVVSRIDNVFRKLGAAEMRPPLAQIDQRFGPVK